MFYRLMFLLGISLLVGVNSFGQNSEPCEDACGGPESRPASAIIDKAKQYPKWAGLFEDELISVEDLRKATLSQAPLLILDARPQKSFYTAHIQGAQLPLTPKYYEDEKAFATGAVPKLPDSDAALKEAMSRHPKDILIVTYCNEHCQASAVLLLKIKALGFTNVRAMEAGFQGWQNKGYPVASPKSPIKK